MHILIVEDNEEHRLLLSRRLQHAGYTFSSAHNGIDALLLAQRLRPAIILMDMSLPDLNGWSVTAQIKASALTRHIPVIALTAHDTEGDRQRCLAAGCNAYLPKPIDFGLLLKTITELGAGSGVRDHGSRITDHGSGFGDRSL